ncbi:MAG: hypothetical protein ACTHKS_08970 [Gaiellaceae bacterium]
MRALRYGVALVVVVDFLVAVVQMQQAVIERASFQKPAVTTYGQFAITLSAKTKDDLDLYVRDPRGHIAWFHGLQAGGLSLEHDMIPGTSDPAKAGVHELTMVRESIPGEYIVNVVDYNGDASATATVQLWDLRGWSKRRLLMRRLTLHSSGEQRTAFRWRLNASGKFAGHNQLPADLLRDLGQT